MAIPTRNTVRDRGVKAPYNLSYINTPNGATITGEIKKYACYKDMMNDAQPARLASVANASHDKDYPVPQDHIGGMLYQRDFVNGTWKLLYTSVDLQVPSTVDWSNILNVPPWVGGVSNNRVRLIANTYAKPRTTYYSFENWILVLPDPNTVELGDQIVLEQYKGQGAICVPYTVGEAETSTLVNIDPAFNSNSLYHVTYTYADYKYTRNEQGEMIIDETVPLGHNSFMFICTETEMHVRVWRLVADESVEEAIINIRKEMTDHFIAKDPHHQYLKKTEVRQYIDSMISIGYILPNASPVKLGGVFLADEADVISGVDGAKVPNAAVLHNLLLGKANAEHQHYLSNLLDVDSSVSGISHGQVLVYESTASKWVPRTLGDGTVVYGPATTTSNGIVYLATMSNFESKDNTARVINCKLLDDVLSNYKKKTETTKFIELDDVDIPQLTNGKFFTVSGTKIVQTDIPSATIASSGLIKIASDADIASGTTVSNKAVTPVQLITVSKQLYDELVQMIEQGGYVLQAATVENLGGARLITDTSFDQIVANYGTLTPVVASSATIVNPMQVAKHLSATKSSVIASASQMIRVASADLNSRVVSNTSKINQVDSKISAHISSSFNPLSSTVSLTSVSNQSEHSGFSSAISSAASAISVLNSHTDILSSSVSALTSSCAALGSNLTSNWDDHDSLRSAIAESAGDRLPTRTVVLWYGHDSEVSETGVLSDWRLCDGKAYLVSNLLANTSEIIVTPNMIGKYPVGASAGESAGVEYAAGLPNVVGEFGWAGLNVRSNDYPPYASSAFTLGNSMGTQGDSDKAFKGYAINFNASSGAVYASTVVESGVTVHRAGQLMSTVDNPYGKSDTVRPPSITFKYIMKITDKTHQIFSAYLPISVTSTVITTTSGTSGLLSIGGYYKNNGVKSSDGLVYYAPNIPAPMSFNSSTGVLKISANASMNLAPKVIEVVCSHSLGICTPLSFNVSVNVYGRLSGTSTAVDCNFTSGAVHSHAYATVYAPYSGAKVTFSMDHPIPGLSMYTSSTNYVSSTIVSMWVSGIASVGYSKFVNHVVATCNRCANWSRTINVEAKPHSMVIPSDFSAIWYPDKISEQTASTAISATNSSAVSILSRVGFVSGLYCTISNGKWIVYNSQMSAVTPTTVPIGSYVVSAKLSAAGASSGIAKAYIEVKNAIRYICSSGGSSWVPTSFSFSAPNIGDTVSSRVSAWCTDRTSTVTLTTDTIPGLSVSKVTGVDDTYDVIYSCMQPGAYHGNVYLETPDVDGEIISIDINSSVE